MSIVFGLTRLEIESVSTTSVADALSTRPLIGTGRSLELRADRSLEMRVIDSELG